MSFIENIQNLCDFIKDTSIQKKKKPITKKKSPQKQKPIQKQKGLRKISERKVGLVRVTEDRNRNALRLRRTEISEIFVELIKNCFEYGRNMEITIDDIEGSITLSNKIKDKKDFESIDFQLLMEKLTSFQEVSSKNFNEGLTTLLLLKYKLSVKNFHIIGEYSGDSSSADHFFQNFDTTTSSHWFDRNTKETFIANEDLAKEFVNTWDVTLYTNETEKILKKNIPKEIKELEELLEQEKKNLQSQTNIKKDVLEEKIKKIKDYIEFRQKYLEKIDNFHLKLKELLIGKGNIEDPRKEESGILNSFYVPKNFKITLNGSPFIPKNPKLPFNKANEYTYNRMKYHLYYILPKPNEKANMFILWQLSREEFYQIIPNSQLDYLDVYGFVILTHNNQFIGESRQNISDYSCGNQIKDEISKFVKEHRDEVELNKKLSEYKEYKEDLLTFFKEAFNIPKKKTREFFFVADLTKQERLIATTNYFYTLKNIFEDYCEIKKKLPKNLERLKELFSFIYFDDEGNNIFNISHHFRHPDSRICPNDLEPEDYKRISEYIEIDWKKIIPDFRVGMIVYMGQPDSIELSNRAITDKEDIKAIDPEEYSLDQVIDSENEQEVFYPLTQYADYLLNLTYVDLEDITEKEEIEVKVLKDIESFDLNKGVKKLKKEYEQYESEEEDVIEEKEEQLSDIEEEIETIGEEIEEADSENEKLKKEEELKEKEKERVKLEEAIEKREEYHSKKDDTEELWDSGYTDNERTEILQTFITKLEEAEDYTDYIWNDLPSDLKTGIILENVRNEEIQKEIGKQWKNSIFNERNKFLKEINKDNDAQQYINYEWDDIPEDLRKRIARATVIKEREDEVETIKKAENNEQKKEDLKKKIKQIEEKRKELKESEEKGADTWDIEEEINHLKEETKKLKEEVFEYEKETDKHIQTIKPKKVVRWGNRTYHLEIIEIEEKEVLYFFNSKKDWENWLKGKERSLFITKKRHNAFQKAIDIIKDIAKIKHSLYFVWYADKNLETKKSKIAEAEAFYLTLQGNGFVAINGYNLVNRFKKMTKTNQSFAIIHLVCHELAHDKVPRHNNRFIKQMEYLMIEAMKQKVDQEVRKCL